MRLVTRHLTPLVATLHRDEGGQTAIAALLTTLVVFILFALGLDAGLWFLDHRTAQNQADAATLAAVQHLPNADTSQATTAANAWLTRNGSGPGQRTCLDYSDRTGDGRFDTVRVCVRRQSPGIFAALSGIPFVFVSAAATATVGPVTISNVVPWGIVPPDPGCRNPGQLCQTEIDVNPVEKLRDKLNVSDATFAVLPNATNFTVGQTIRIESERMKITGKGASSLTVIRGTDGTAAATHSKDTPIYRRGACGDYLSCPWGLREDQLYPFKASGAITPGNFGALAACGQGVSNYKACINGATVSGYYAEGQTVNVEPQTGAGGGNTNTALNERYSAEAADGVYECDIESTPDATTGLDADGRAAAVDKFVNQNIGCEVRLVAAPIIDHFPSGGSDPILVLGVVTFAIAKWDRVPPSWGDPLGTSTKACGQASGSGFQCGMVWGYLIRDAIPPNFLVQQIDDTENPFAPLLIAMVD